MTNDQRRAVWEREKALLCNDCIDGDGCFSKCSHIGGPPDPGPVVLYRALKHAVQDYIHAIENKDEDGALNALDKMKDLV